MIKDIKTTELFDCQTEYLKELFSECEYPWEILPKIKNYIEKITTNGLEGFTEIQKGLFVGKNVKIYPTATIEGLCILGDNTEVRPGAFIRGNVITGKDCVIGNSTEVKNSVLLQHVQIPHYNYVGDSILGNNAHMGAAAVCSNLKSDGKNIVIHGEKDYETGLRKIGGILGDKAEIGCGCVLNPGTVIGRRTAAYPLLSLRGIYPEGCIIKNYDNVVIRTQL